jgi:lysophospholipase L1-like esterase
LVQNPTDEFQAIKGICLEKVFPEFVFTNLAISGSTSFELLEHELPRLAQADSNTLGIVVITTGGNDLIHNYGRTPPRKEAMYGATLDEAKSWINDFEQRIELMVQQIESKVPSGCRIYLKIFMIRRMESATRRGLICQRGKMPKEFSTLTTM